MHTPPALKKGDKIGIVSPAGKINKESILPALNKLHEWGLEIELGKHIFNENFQFAGTDEDRAADLQKMLDDKSIKLIISARGGYGMLRIIDKLDFKIFSKHPTWIVGYSDITVLHAHVHRNYGIETVHAIMANVFDKNEEAVDTLRKALFNEPLSYRVKSHLLNRKGEGKGEVIGGNLSLLYALSASRSDIDTKGKLLFIEDLNEYLYHIDRMMMNLKRAGKLKGLAGLVVGGMTDMKDNPNPFGKTAEEIILEAVAEYNYPVCFNFPAGHIEKNLALVFGREARFSVDDTEVILRY